MTFEEMKAAKGIQFTETSQIDGIPVIAHFTIINFDKEKHTAMFTKALGDHIIKTVENQLSHNDKPA